jgi:hypothetical protein
MTVFYVSPRLSLCVYYDLYDSVIPLKNKNKATIFYVSLSLFLSVSLSPSLSLISLSLSLSPSFSLSLLPLSRSLSPSFSLSLLPLSIFISLSLSHTLSPLSLRGRESSMHVQPKSAGMLWAFLNQSVSIRDYYINTTISIIMTVK